MPKKISLLCVINFLSAFLLFQIELIIAKIFLPKFGSSYLMWGSCVVFFQCVLLLGYLYSHLVTKMIGISRYRYFHLVLILLPLAVFPGHPLPPVFVHNNVPLVADIFMQLAVSIGLVFFVLSTISVISQNWLVSSELGGRVNPYMLYAVSNAGSFLGLLSYPFIFESTFGLKEQLVIWRSVYIVFIGFYLIAFKTIASPGPDKFTKQPAFSGLSRLNFLWVLLSAAGCIMFLSVTNIITYELAPCPLLWIIPLCIYLMTFTLTFRDKPVCPSWIKDKIHLVLGFSVLLYFFTERGFFPDLITIAAQLICLFAVCMYCQYQLYTSRPKDNSSLSTFYLLISLGGFLGSFFVTWIAPVIFNSACEYLLGLAMVSAACLFKGEKGRVSIDHACQIICLMLAFYFWPFIFKKYNFFGIIFLVLSVKIVFSNLKANPRAVFLVMALIFFMNLFTERNWCPVEKYLYVKRNYYGLYSVFANGGFLELTNGTTVHGLQYSLKAKENEPLAYYHRETPLGKILESNDFPLGHIGVIGLGVGTVSAYGRDDEAIDFYEIDKDVVWIAENLFSYLGNSKAKTKFILGDARVSLKDAPDGSYDLLVVDAFSGDYIPVHLLTTDAIREYRRCLKKKGIILFHISNRYLDLAPVLSSNSSMAGAYPLKNGNNYGAEGHFSSAWMALTWDKEIQDTLISKYNWKHGTSENSHGTKVRPWTDDYNNLLSVIKINYMVKSIKSFKPFNCN